MSIKGRIEQLENREEAMDTENHTILKVQYDGEPEPTEEEVEAAKKKFLEIIGITRIGKNDNHQGLIVLNFARSCKVF